MRAFLGPANLPANFSVDVVIPVLNEAHVLRKSVETLLYFLQANLDYRWQVVIVDNGSTDGTQNVARELTAAHSQVLFSYRQQRGRGRALRYAWLQSRADIVCYMDVDLSTKLDHLQALLDAIAFEGYDVSIGSRLMRDSRTTRSFKREVISRIYNVMVKAVLATRFSDAQCGFKNGQPASRGSHRPAHRGSILVLRYGVVGAGGKARLSHQRHSRDLDRG